MKPIARALSLIDAVNPEIEFLLAPKPVKKNKKSTKTKTKIETKPGMQIETKPGRKIETKIETKIITPSRERKNEDAVAKSAPIMPNQIHILPVDKINEILPLNTNGFRGPSCEVYESEGAVANANIDMPNQKQILTGYENNEIPPLKTMVFRGSESEVYSCAWNPTTDHLASGSGDGTIRVWDTTNYSQSPLMIRRCIQLGETDMKKSKAVTTLDWNYNGTLLASAYCDGFINIWTKEGRLANTLCEHEESIFSVKWNKVGSFIVASVS